MDYDTGEILTTDDWIMVFVYKDFTIAIELREVGSKEVYINLVKYFESMMLDFHRVELADITAQELYKIIEDFINRKEVKTNECI